MARAKKNPIKITGQSDVQVVEEDFLDDDEGGNSFAEMLAKQEAKEKEEAKERAFYTGEEEQGDDGAETKAQADAQAAGEATEEQPPLEEEGEGGGDDDDLDFHEADLEAIELDIKTLKGDVRTALLDRIRENSDWPKLTRAHQRSIAWDMERTANHIITTCLQIMNENRDAVVRIKADVGNVQRNKTQGSRIEMKLFVRAGTEHDELLLTAETQERGVHILVMPASEDGYRGEKKAVDEEVRASDQERLIG